MIYTDRSDISFRDALPERVDVVIIGGGVVGISAAWFLQKSGLSVLVCEKGRVAGEQSSRNWGWIRQQGRDPAELPIVIDSINSWERISKEVDEDIGFTRRGVLYAASTDSQLEEYEKWISTASEHQLDTRMVTRKEIDSLIKGTPNNFKGGIHTPSDGRAEPFKAVPSLARALRKRGARIRENCAVRSLDMRAGKVGGVATEEGQVRTSSVICAGGAWSTQFLANLGVTLPQLSVRATVARTSPGPGVCEGNASLDEIAIRKRQDNGYTVASSSTNEHFIGGDSFRYFFRYLPALAASLRYIRLRVGGDTMSRMLPKRRWKEDEVTPFEETRVLNPPPSEKALQRMRLGLKKRIPALAELPFEESWAGMIDVTPDIVPVMDEIRTHPGLYLATGFSGHGFGIGPGAGRVMADMVLGNTPAFDLDRFRFSRFSDGTRMVPGPGL